jgi:prolyl 4-hydroxylase
MQLSDLVRVYPEAVDRETCQELIEQFDARPDQHVIHTGEGYRFAELNVTQHWPEAHQLAFQAILPHFEQYSRDLGLGATQWPEHLAFEELRLKRYLANDSDEFEPHVDVMDHSTARRFLVAFLYLNDVKCGGETEFPLWGQAVRPKAGTLLMFPPLWPWLHAGRRPISGPKYILSTYLHYT